MQKKYSPAISMFAILWVVPGQAHAYLDPGAGSMILQLILGGVGGLVVLAKLYLRKVTHLFGRQEQEPESAQTVAEGASGLAEEKERIATQGETHGDVRREPCDVVKVGLVANGG
jgi:hypothetical protein